MSVTLPATQTPGPPQGHRGAQAGGSAADHRDIEVPCHVVRHADLPEHHGDVMQNFASTLADLASWRYGR
jgi:hypothetical protein